MPRRFGDVVRVELRAANSAATGAPAIVRSLIRPELIAETGRIADENGLR